jgi:hypothetical protein
MGSLVKKMTMIATTAKEAPISDFSVIFQMKRTKSMAKMRMAV